MFSDSIMQCFGYFANRHQGIPREAFIQPRVPGSFRIVSRTVNGIVAVGEKLC